jgi:hypothetical protein
MVAWGVAVHPQSDAPVGPAGCGANESCRGPWAPGNCASMLSCITSIAPVTRVASAVPAARVTLIAREPVSPRLGPTFAPEPPPPRV